VCERAREKYPREDFRALESAAAAVCACVRAQSRPKHVPVFTQIPILTIIAQIDLRVAPSLFAREQTASYAYYYCCYCCYYHCYCDIVIIIVIAATIAGGRVLLAPHCRPYPSVFGRKRYGARVRRISRIMTE